MTREMCVFCGIAVGSTRDHIPPKTLFSSPRPPNLITVPSCHECNLGTSKDDMYFRDCLVFGQETSSPVAKAQIGESVLRSFRMPERKGYCQSFMNNVVNIDLVSNGGIYLGKANALKIREDRLVNIASKIVQGLFFHEYGAILPNSHSAIAMPLTKRVLAEPQCRDGIHETCNHLMTATQRTTIGQGVFSYWHHRYEEDPYQSLWLLLFFERTAFLGMTPNRDRLQRKENGDTQKWPRGTVKES
jgi:hypothetical protein